MYGNPNKNNWIWQKRRLAFALFFLLILLVVGAVVQLLWNTILTDVTPVKRLNFGQALGLLILCRILFGRFRFGYRGRSPLYKNSQSLRAKWLKMTEEERITFKEQWKKRCEQRRF